MYMKQKLHYIIIVVSFIVLFFSLFSYIEAAEVGLATTKTVYDLELPPGGSFEDSIVVFNESEDLALPVIISLNLWNLREDADELEFIVAEPLLNATRWFTLEGGSNLLLDPDQAEEVTFRIAVPPETPLGSYFVMMRFEAALPEHYFEEEGPRFIPEVGVLFFIRVRSLNLEGEGSTFGAEILSLNVKGALSIGFLARILPRAQAGVYEALAEELTSKIRATGLYHFKTSGFIEIKNIFGRTVARAEFPNRILIPNRTRTIDLEILETDASFFKRNLHFGPYSAIAVLNVPESDIPVVQRIDFWLFPWKLLLLTFLPLATLFILRRRLWLAFRILLRK